MTFWYPFLQGYCAVLKGPGRLSSISGGYGEGETPLPFPNRAVKPLRADGTWPARARESRSPPVSSAQRTAPRGGPFVVVGAACCTAGRGRARGGGEVARAGAAGRAGWGGGRAGGRGHTRAAASLAASGEQG